MDRVQSDIGPAPDAGVMAALKRAVPDVYPVWRNHVINRLEGAGFAPLIRDDGERIPYPRWHLFLDHKGSGKQVYMFCLQDPTTGEGLPLDHRCVTRILADAGRVLPANVINQMIDDAKKLQAEEEERDRLELQQDVIKANSRKIGEVLEGDNLFRGPSNNTRAPAVSSFPGATNRRSSAEQEQIPLTAEEEGWELPKRKENA